jgi:protein TonB
MFEQMLLPTGGTHQARSTAIAFAGQIALVAIATLVIPGLFVETLPTPEFLTVLVAPPSPPPPPPPSAATRAPAFAKAVPRTFNFQPVTAPQSIPQQAPMVADALPPVQDLPGAGQVGGVVGGVAGGVPGGSLNGVVDSLPAPPQSVPAAPPPPAAPQTPAQIRVGGDVEAGRLAHEIVPTYPPLAKSARIEGVVHLSATIAPDGSVKELRVLSGQPLLVGAAVDAVKQWTYQPTFLNGKPVEVLTEIDVKFALG